MSLPHPSVAPSLQQRCRALPPVAPGEAERRFPRPPAAGIRSPPAAGSPLPLSNIAARAEAPRILRMCFFLTKILGYCLSVTGKALCHVRNKLPNFLHQVMDIIIIRGGICHCTDFHCYSQKFPGKVEVSNQWFSQETHRQRSGAQQRGQGEKRNSSASPLLFFLKAAWKSLLVIYGMAPLPYVLNFLSKDPFSQKRLENLPKRSSWANLFFDKQSASQNV